MNDYSKHIAIIGAGIAGLSLGCFLLRKGIKPIIFERSSQIREGGSGISISPNAINLLDKINLKESLSNEGFFPEKAFGPYQVPQYSALAIVLQKL